MYFHVLSKWANQESSTVRSTHSFLVFVVVINSRSTWGVNSQVGIGHWRVHELCGFISRKILIRIIIVILESFACYHRYAWRKADLYSVSDMRNWSSLYQLVNKYTPFSLHIWYAKLVIPVSTRTQVCTPFSLHSATLYVVHKGWVLLIVTGLRFIIVTSSALVETFIQYVDLVCNCER